MTDELSPAITTEQLKTEEDMPVINAQEELKPKSEDAKVETPEEVVVAAEEPIKEAVKAEVPTTAAPVAVAVAKAGVFVPGPSTVPTDRTAQKAMILRQVEFYFGDSNLPRDEFLWKNTRKTPEGWVSLDLLNSFKRMRRFVDREIVVEALKESKELLEVSEDNTMVRRKTPLVYPAGQMERSIYVKGLGDETETLQDELDDFFGQFGKCLEVRMRRGDNKVFKGSLFVEYSKDEDAEKVVNSELEFKGTKLSVMSKDAYCNMKAKEKGIDMKARKLDFTQPRPFSAWRELRAEEAAKQGGKQGGKQEGQQNEKEDVKIEYEKGCLFRFRCPDNVQWFAIKDAVKDKAPIKFVKFDEGSNNSGVGVLAQPQADALLKDYESVGFEIEGGKIEISAMDAEAEALWYAAKAGDGRRNARDGRGGGGRGGRGGRGQRGGRPNRGGNSGGDRKRKAGQDGAESIEKRSKVDG